MSTRGRGAAQTKAPVRLKLARILLKKESEQVRQDIYEDRMVCVTNNGRVVGLHPNVSVRRRGRPKKRVYDDTKPLLTPLDLSNSSEVIYIPSPSSAKRTYNVLPLKKQVNISHKAGLGHELSILKRNVQGPKPRRGVEPAAFTVSQTFSPTVATMPSPQPWRLQSFSLNKETLEPDQKRSQILAQILRDKSVTKKPSQTVAQNSFLNLIKPPAQNMPLNPSLLLSPSQTRMNLALDLARKPESVVNTTQESFQQSAVQIPTMKYGEYPEDLAQLVKEFNNLPDALIRELGIWLATINKSYPRVVESNHKLIEELFPEPDLETKMTQVAAWLEEHCSNFQPKIIPPKVVVEAQPNLSQMCNQWYSMSDNHVCDV